MSKYNIHSDFRNVSQPKSGTGATHDYDIDALIDGLEKHCKRELKIMETRITSAKKEFNDGRISNASIYDPAAQFANYNNARLILQDLKSQGRNTLTLDPQKPLDQQVFAHKGETTTLSYYKNLKPNNP